MTPPEFWIIAGVNGAGKSTLVSDKDIRSAIGQFPFLNPDLPVPCLRATLPGISVTEANYAAVVAVEAIVERRIAGDRSVGVETVLNSSKYMRHVHEARRRGFFLGLIYVGLPSVELAIRRVADRHALADMKCPKTAYVIAGPARTITLDATLLRLTCYSSTRTRTRRDGQCWSRARPMLAWIFSARAYCRK